MHSGRNIHHQTTYADDLRPWLTLAVAVVRRARLDAEGRAFAVRSAKKERQAIEEARQWLADLQVRGR